MDPTMALQEVLDRLAAVAAAYDVPDEAIVRRGDELREAEWLHRKGFVTVRLQLTLMELAELHRGVCSGGCRGCKTIREALALNVAELRLSMNEQLRSMVGDDDESVG